LTFPPSCTAVSVSEAAEAVAKWRTRECRQGKRSLWLSGTPPGEFANFPHQRGELVLAVLQRRSSNVLEFSNRWSRLSLAAGLPTELE
jgi:hypothetical protein